MRLAFLSAIFVTCFCFYVLGQKALPLDSIKNFVQDSLSNPNYKLLIEKFNNDPVSLNPVEGGLIYYGRSFSGYNPYKINFDEIDFEKLVGKRKYKPAIIKRGRITKR